MTAGASPREAGLPRVYITGPIAASGEAARGGYQSCNRRTIDALSARGVDVQALPYPHPRAHGWRKMSEYLIGFLGLYGQILRCRRGSILHITAVGAHFIYIEWPLVQFGRLRGCRVIFDVRAGAARMLYEGGHGLFRRVYRSILASADEVMVEGEAFVPFLGSLLGRPPVLLPNHLDVDALPARPAADALPESGPLALIFVGRIARQKGVDIALEACRSLQSAGLAVRLQLVGDGEPDYLASLRRQAEGLDVQWLGSRPPDEVLAMLRKADFFLFPTFHFGEGQSNALTEAMACGCVPIASDHGFNASVIGPAGVTLPPGSPGSAYAREVLEIWRAPGRWSVLSAAAVERARSRFSTGPVVDRLMARYRALVT